MLLPTKYKFLIPVLFVLAGVVSFTPVLDDPGLQQTLALAFLFGALALSYDLLLGFTGLLSFGHSL
jgi:ABC-type branched-subunit amino acid transport system permease subunit